MIINLSKAVYIQARRNRSGRSGHGPTKILANNTFFLRDFCGGGARLDWGVIQLDRTFGMFGAL